MAKATNVTKYDAGGFGVNLIPDGYIKTIEKIWLDAYAFTSAVPSLTTIDLAVIPAGKKITSIDVTFPSLTTATDVGSGPTISLGYKKASGVTNSTAFLSAAGILASTLNVSANAGIATVTDSVWRIYLTVDTLATNTTAGTITTIVRYT
jgi:hypothetical protein